MTDTTEKEFIISQSTMQLFMNHNTDWAFANNINLEQLCLFFHLAFKALSEDLNLVIKSESSTEIEKEVN